MVHQQRRALGRDPETAMQETMPGYAFGLWYDYDPATHVLSARPDLVYSFHHGRGRGGSWFTPPAATSHNVTRSRALTAQPD